MTPPVEFTGYVLVSISVNDDDTPTREPGRVAAEIITSAIPGVVSARPVASAGDGTYYPYGEEFVA